MKRLARIPTVFALVAMVAACTDMTAPEEVTPPQFGLSGNIECNTGDGGFSFGGTFLIETLQDAIQLCLSGGGHPGRVTVN